MKQLGNGKHIWLALNAIKSVNTGSLLSSVSTLTHKPKILVNLINFYMFFRLLNSCVVHDEVKQA